jgi:hypothetical protein
VAYWIGFAFSSSFSSGITRIDGSKSLIPDFFYYSFWISWISAILSSLSNAFLNLFGGSL